MTNRSASPPAASSEPADHADALAPLRFDGRVVLVTGAGRGIGRATAELLALRGARVLVHNRRSPDGREDPAGELAAAMRARGGEAVAVDGDLRERDTASSLVAAALGHFGRLDAVVLNAGVIESQPVAELDETDLVRLFEINTLSAFRLTRAALSALRRHGVGRLVYTTSTAGLYGGEGLAAYGMAKGALLALMRAVAAEERSHGVLANAVCPTALTRMTEAFVADPSLHAALAPEHVAPAIAWLASEACHVTGQTVLACGGLFRSAHTLQSAAVDLRALHPVGPEHVALHADAILAPTGLRSQADAGSHFAAMIEELRREPSPNSERRP